MKLTCEIQDFPSRFCGLVQSKQIDRQLMYSNQDLQTESKNDKGGKNNRGKYRHNGEGYGKREMKN
jgi:hypothetical protein